MILGFFSDVPGFGQTSSPTGQEASLSFHDKMRLKRARDQVLADNPELKAQQEALAKQGSAVKSAGAAATPEQRRALAQGLAKQEKNMRAAIVKIDPTLGPIFDQMVKQKMQERAAQDGGGN
jgi:hypothetical protein